MNILYVFIGGGIGCVTRYGISAGLKNSSFTLPVATLLANVIACIIFAIVLMAYKTQNISSDSFKLVLLTGFCGGLSTFSTFSYESMELVKNGNYMWACANIALNIILCFACFALVSTGNKS